MPSECPLRVPDDLRPVATGRPTGLAHWGVENLSRLHTFTRPLAHLLTFAPQTAAPDGWSAAIRSSQFPRECSRYLLVEDDLVGAGLGFEARMWTSALLLAVRDQRVLLETKLDMSWGSGFAHGWNADGKRTRRNASAVPRWCARPPFTMACLYEPWTYCPEPSKERERVSLTLKDWNGHKSRSAAWKAYAAGRTVSYNSAILDGVFEGSPPPSVLRVKLSMLAKQTEFWQKGRSNAAAAAHAFLFRPREWVRAIGDCVMRRAGLVRNHFTTVHIRHSASKLHEILRSGGRAAGMPDSRAYVDLVRQLASTTSDLKHVFVQTASTVALQNFSDAALADGLLHVSHTDGHSRSEDDSWGGHQLGSEMCVNQRLRTALAHPVPSP